MTYPQFLTWRPSDEPPGVEKFQKMNKCEKIFSTACMSHRERENDRKRSVHWARARTCRRSMFDLPAGQYPRYRHRSAVWWPLPTSAHAVQGWIGGERLNVTVGAELCDSKQLDMKTLSEGNVFRLTRFNVPTCYKYRTTVLIFQILWIVGCRALIFVYLIPPY